MHKSHVFGRESTRRGVEVYGVNNVDMRVQIFRVAVVATTLQELQFCDTKTMLG